MHLCLFSNFIFHLPDLSANTQLTEWHSFILWAVVQGSYILQWVVRRRERVGSWYKVPPPFTEDEAVHQKKTYQLSHDARERCRRNVSTVSVDIQSLKLANYPGSRVKQPSQRIFSLWKKQVCRPVVASSANSRGILEKKNVHRVGQGSPWLFKTYLLVQDWKHACEVKVFFNNLGC